MPPTPEHRHGVSLTQEMGLQTHIPAWFWGYPKYSSTKLEAVMENQSQDSPRGPRQSRQSSVLVPRQSKENPEHPRFWNSGWEWVPNTIHELFLWTIVTTLTTELLWEITEHPHPNLAVFAIQELLLLLIWNNGRVGKIPHACTTPGWRRHLPQSSFTGLNLNGCAGEQLRFCPANSVSETDCCHLLQNGKRFKKNPPDFLFLKYKILQFWHEKTPNQHYSLENVMQTKE